MTTTVSEALIIGMATTLIGLGSDIWHGKYVDVPTGRIALIQWLVIGTLTGIGCPVIHDATNHYIPVIIYSLLCVLPGSRAGIIIKIAHQRRLQRRARRSIENG